MPQMLQHQGDTGGAAAHDPGGKNKQRNSNGIDKISEDDQCKLHQSSADIRILHGSLSFPQITASENPSGRFSDALKYERRKGNLPPPSCL